MKHSRLLKMILIFPVLLGILYVGHAQSMGRPKLIWLPRVAQQIATPLEPPIRIWPPRPRPPIIWWPPIQQVLTVQSINVTATIRSGVAQTDVEQLWRNDTERPQEGVYLFPVPAGATLSDFALYDGDKKRTARLLDKDEASATYENIVRQIRDPALLQYVGRNTYEVKLFPVPPHATRKITLRYTEALRSDDGSTRKYVYSFVADAMGGTQRASAPPKSTTIQVMVNDDAPLANIYSPLHDISIRRSGDRSATVTWEAKDEHVKDDFILYYSATRRDPVGLSLLAYNVSLPHAQTAAFTPGTEGKRGSGYFLLMASPKTDLPDTQILPKRVVLVLDRSGSMSGEKIEQARGALSYVLKNLRPNDRFNVMTFNESNDVFSSEGLPAATPDNIRRGLAFVRDIQAEGGTNIDDALATALQMFPASKTDGRQNMVIFLTDGMPTVGETDESKIIAHARMLGRARGIRLFDFGVGYDADVPFLDRLAQQNKGDSDYVRPEEDIEAKVSRFYKKVASPVLTDVQLEINGIKTADVYPRPDDLPDLFAGSQLLIAGRYAGQGPVTARLVGSLNGKPTSYALNATLPAVADTNDFLPRLWATRKIGYLLDAIRLRQTEGAGGAADRELVDEVVRLSHEYGVVTPYTSFLITDSPEQPPVTFSPMPMGGGIRHGFGGGFGSNGVNAPVFDRATTGAGAMAQSQALRAAKKATTADGLAGLNESQKQAAHALIRVAGAKTFFLQNGVWTDSAYDAGSRKDVTTVQAYSDAHFALLKILPSLADYSALGDDVLIVLDSGRVLHIVPKGGATTLDRAARAALMGH